MKRWLPLAMVFFLLLTGRPHAQQANDENADLNLIPKTLEAPRPPPVPAGPARWTGRAYLENALTGWVNQGLPVEPPTESPTWQNRTSLDVDTRWQPAESFRLHLSDRLNVLAGDTISFPSGENLRNDFREGYLSWELVPRTFLEVGRINLKNGVALGYNPTDYFKTRATVSIASMDPSAQRENRLGALMIKGQRLFNSGAVTIIFSPKVASPSVLSASQGASFNPLFGRTNSENRFLVSFSCNATDFNPQVLVFVDKDGPRYGLNISRGIGSSLVLYGEWSGGRTASLTSRSLSFGKDTGSLPRDAPLLPQTETGKRFQNDLSLGASWTSPFRLTVNLEYHFHQAGFDNGDFSDWVRLGRSNAGLASEFWFIRQYATDRQEPLMQQQVFLRLDWPDVIPSRLDAGCVFFISPRDGSFLTQVSAQYYISRNWTVGAYLGGTSGASDTVYGSLPWCASAVLQVVRYL